MGALKGGEQQSQLQTRPSLHPPSFTPDLVRPHPLCKKWLSPHSSSPSSPPLQLHHPPNILPKKFLPFVRLLPLLLLVPWRGDLGPFSS